MSLNNKIDFAIVFSVKNANPNGDPLNGNRPRIDYDGYGEITDVCLKRKIRDRLMERGEDVFVQSDHNKRDGMTSLKNRAEHKKFGLGSDAFNAKKTAPDDCAKMACKKWFDVRTFGQLFAWSDKDKGKDKDKGVSIAIRGPVTIQSAFSVEPINITSTQITKSVNSVEGEVGGKTSDTMGMKHRVDSAVYVTYGSMNPQLSERTGFSNEDAEALKDIFPKIFEGDASSARPEGSMAVMKVVWWEHNCKSGQYSSAKVHKTLKVSKDGTINEEELRRALDNLVPEVIDGF